MNIAMAKARLSELVALAEAGEEVIIARDGKPVVTLTPRSPRPDTSPRPLGLWQGAAPLADPDLFLRPDPAMEALMNESAFPSE
jgi:prevent-host-death family protein